MRGSDPRARELAFVSTTPGLEPALDGELRSLGFEPTTVEGGFEVLGPAGLCRDLCVGLRTASHVLLRVGSCRFGDPRTLEQELRGVSIAESMAPGTPIVRAHVKRSRVSVEQVEATARRAWGLGSEADSDGTRILLRVDGDGCTVSVDCAGDFLYRRGYRQETSMAPLRETLAAGILLLARYDGSEALVDPFCGSGTILVEAALISMRRAPGLGRSFDFERWHSAAVPLTPTLSQRERGTLGFPICGSDIHAGALGVARRNAKRAGVFEHLKLARVDAAVVTPPPDTNTGLVVANLPYGKRASETAQLRKIYSAFGSRLVAAFQGWRAAILLADPQLEPLLRIKPDRVYPLENGGIPCRLVVGSVSPDKP